MRHWLASYLISLWEGLGLGMQIELHSICIAERYGGRWTAFHSTRDVLKEHSPISRILDTSISQHNYRVRLSKEPHSITPSIFSTEPHGRARAAFISLPSIGHLSDVPIPTTHESLARKPAETKCATHLAGGKQEGEGTSEDAHRWGVLRGWFQVE